MSTEDTAKLILVGSVIVGGFALGKAVIDHVLLTAADNRKPFSSEDEADFASAHYRAAGFRKASRPKLDDVVSVVAAIGGIGYTLSQAPSLLTELKALGK